MSNWTRLFLVVLRVAIGWHFLFEGLDKLNSAMQDPVEGKPPAWSSDVYLRESTGPLASFFRAQSSESDEAALERLTLPLTSDQPRLPAALEKDWDAQIARLKVQYGIVEDKPIAREVVGVVAVAPGPFPAAVAWYPVGVVSTNYATVKGTALAWFQSGERDAPRVFAQINEVVKETTPQRVAAYKAKLKDIKEKETSLRAFGHDVQKEKLKALKKEAAVMRTELLADANRPFKEYLDLTLKLRLPKEPTKEPAPTFDPKRTKLTDFERLGRKDFNSLFSSSATSLQRNDIITRWGLTIVGACLILGLFTRLSCLAGAVFLLLVYAAMPPFPWLPLNPKSEGHYFFINKNLIEMIALLALATTSSGKWLGLDGLLQFLNPFSYRSRKPAPSSRVSA